MYKPTTEEDIWARIDKREDGCWIWGGAYSSQGVAVCQVDRKTCSVARFVWVYEFGSMDGIRSLMPTCDTHGCVSPEHRRPMPFVDRSHAELPPYEKFAERVSCLKTPDGCMHWTGEKTNRGYGRFMHKGHPFVASRLAYIYHFGAIPDGLIVRHKCDNRLCVNWEHLEVGTQGDNIADIFLRHKNAHHVGEKHRHSKITQEQANLVWSLHKDGVTTRVAAERAGVGWHIARQIVSGCTWNEVTGLPRKYGRGRFLEAPCQKSP